MRLMLMLMFVAVGWPSLARAEPFQQLRDAYAARDAKAAAAAYGPSASIEYRDDGAPSERAVGTAAIEASFRAFFARVGAKQPIDLNFRTLSRTADGATGIYRLRVGRTSASFGKFAVTFGRDGKFATDLSTSATVFDFEGAKGPVLLAPGDETLDRAYYRRLAGRYRLSTGCEVVVTRSSVRLFARDTCSNAWRGLNRVSGRESTASDRVLSDKVGARYLFADPIDRVSRGGCDDRLCQPPRHHHRNPLRTVARSVGLRANCILT